MGIETVNEFRLNHSKEIDNVDLSSGLCQTLSIITDHLMETGSIAWVDGAAGQNGYYRDWEVTTTKLVDSLKLPDCAKGESCSMSAQLQQDGGIMMGCKTMIFKTEEEAVAQESECSRTYTNTLSTLGSSLGAVEVEIDVHEDLIRVNERNIIALRQKIQGLLGQTE